MPFPLLVHLAASAQSWPCNPITRNRAALESFHRGNFLTETSLVKDTLAEDGTRTEGRLEPRRARSLSSSTESE